MDDLSIETVYVNWLDGMKTSLIDSTTQLPFMFPYCTV